jgi:hypothetical protein
MRWGMSAWSVDGDPIGRDESPEVLEAAPLIASLEQLATSFNNRAANAIGPEPQARRAYKDAARELRSLIESLNQETDTNAD